MRRFIVLSLLLSILLVIFVGCSNPIYVPTVKGWFKYKSDEYIYYKMDNFPEYMGNETEEYVNLYDQPNFKESFEYSKIKDNLKYIEEQYWGIPEWARDKY